MAWIYRLSRNDRYPDPMAEVRALAEVSAAGGQAFLLLSDRPHPALAGRDVRRGEPIYLATSGDQEGSGGLLVRAAGRVGTLHHGSTPASVGGIYGEREGRYFREVVDLATFGPEPVSARVLGLSAEMEATLLRGQAHGKIFSPVNGVVPPTSGSRSAGSPLRRVYDGLTEAEIDEIEELTLSRSRN